MINISEFLVKNHIKKDSIKILSKDKIRYSSEKNPIIYNGLSIYIIMNENTTISCPKDENFDPIYDEFIKIMQDIKNTTSYKFDTIILNFKRATRSIITFSLDNNEIVDVEYKKLSKEFTYYNDATDAPLSYEDFIKLLIK